MYFRQDITVGLARSLIAAITLLQSAVERFGFVRMMQSALLQLSGVGVN
jgi:hypothetical protein